MRTITITLITAVALSLTACKNEQKKTEQEIIAPKYELPKPKPPIRMQESVMSNNFNIGGQKFKSVITRTASDSLPSVKDNIGQVFIDNIITLSVSKEDGNSFAKFRFTKTAFNKYLTQMFREEGILDGMAFDCTEGDTAYFGASVSIPQSDEFMPFSVKLAGDGSITIALDTTNENIQE